MRIPDKRFGYRKHKKFPDVNMKNRNLQSNNGPKKRWGDAEEEAKLPKNEINTFTSVQAHDLTSQDPTSIWSSDVYKEAKMDASSGQQCNSKNLKQFKCPLHMSITYIHTCSCMYCTYVTNTVYITCMQTHVHPHCMHTDIACMNACDTYIHIPLRVCAPSAHIYTLQHTRTCRCGEARVCPEACTLSPSTMPPLSATNNSPLKAVARELY